MTLCRLADREDREKKTPQAPLPSSRTFGSERVSELPCVSVFANSKPFEEG